jgi:hypothetical protein
VPNSAAPQLIEEISVQPSTRRPAAVEGDQVAAVHEAFARQAP